MKGRPPFALRNTLTFWNFLLAVFSFLGTIRTWPEMMFILGNNPEGFRRGFHLSVCQRSELVKQLNLLVCVLFCSYFHHFMCVHFFPPRIPWSNRNELFLSLHKNRHPAGTTTTRRVRSGASCSRCPKPSSWETRSS